MLASTLSFLRKIRFFKIVTWLFFIASFVLLSQIIAKLFFNFELAYLKNIRLSNLVILCLACFLTFLIFASRRIVHILAYRLINKKGNKLLKRVVLIFIFISALPVILVGAGALIFLNSSVDSWFNDKVRTAVTQSVSIADAYLNEHQKMIKLEANQISKDIIEKFIELGSDYDGLQIFLSKIAYDKLLSEVILIDGITGENIALNTLASNINYKNIPREVRIQASTGTAAIVPTNDSSKIAALLKLEPFENIYLYISRYVDSNVVSYTNKAKGAAKEYQRLQDNISKYKDITSVGFIIIALLILLIAIWIGVIFAHNLVNPITNLSDAAHKIADGNYDFDLKDNLAQQNEISELSESFESMSAELQRQRQILLVANKQIDERRKFNQAILQDISAGVAVLDEKLDIIVLNTSARDILNIKGKKYVGKPIADSFPEVAKILDSLERRGDQQQQLKIKRGGKVKILLLKASMLADKNKSYIVTFDDITELEKAQRSSAWQDVARRIAHEIKNPLTPINLSAQRLKRKYAGKVDDVDNFNKYADTIINNTDDISRIISEFANFARMPAPKFELFKIINLLKKTVSGFAVNYKDITFNFDAEAKKDLEISADKGLINQVISNIIKNSIEAFEDYKQASPQIIIEVEQADNKIVLQFSDNGPGFSDNIMERLAEPYVTTKEKGTGLGLAIVSKIIEDHSGTIEMQNIEQGAKTTITLPL